MAGPPLTKFTIIIQDNQSTPIERANLKGIASNVRISTMLPGGCSVASFEVPGSEFGVLTTPEYVSWNYKVRFLDAGVEFWSGRLDDAQLSRRASGWWWRITAKGFFANLDDQQYLSQDVSGLQTSSIIANVIASLTQQIQTTSITATGFTLSGAAAINLKMLSAAQIVSWAAMFGDSQFREQIWYVYPDSDGTVRFTYKPRPTTPDLECSVRGFRDVSFRMMGRNIANRVIAQYNAGASTVMKEDTDLQSAGPLGYNVIRSARFFVPEVSQSADAQQAAQVALNMLKYPRMSADAITTGPQTTFRDANENIVPLHMVRSGMLLKFDDVPPATTQQDGVGFNNYCMIVGTDYDEATQTLTIRPETYDNVIDKMIAKSYEILVGRHTVYTP